ncbi:MAG TPA: biotin/lipoyl-binding protein [bacterium]|nr:biotin/lipoyl-binding protein [bacterium]
MNGNRRALVTALVVAALMITSSLPASAQRSTVLVRVVISGEVLPLQLAKIGQTVKQGDPLVFLRGTSSGAAVPAAVASIDGRVVQVMVRPGDHVNIGDVVAVIQPQ